MATPYPPESTVGLTQLSLPLLLHETLISGFLHRPFLVYLEFVFNGLNVQN